MTSALSHHARPTTATTTTTTTSLGVELETKLLTAGFINNSTQGHLPPHMLAAQTQSTAKRRALDMDTSMNPLLAAAAAKRAKKDKSANNKRKLLQNEDAPGGLLIVRTEPESSFPQPSLRAASSQPTFSNTQSKPPSKKFRADSQPPPRSKPQQPLARKPSTSSRLLEDDEASHSDADLERDVRAMEDEADRLRRSSRAHTVIDQSLLASNSQGSSSTNNSSSNMFAFPPPSMTSKSKTPASGRGRQRSQMEVDTQVPIAENETPQQQRNKRLREGAMAAIASGQDDEDGSATRGRGASSSKSGHRRASSLSRGKRISTSYETTGIITQPHNSVSEASFYKHIDADLPDVERVRQLLIWCSLRSASTYNKPSTSAAGSSKTPLPPLSAKGAEVLKKAQDEFVRALAEKRIDLNVHDSPQPPNNNTTTAQEENEQNVRNRNWEITYSSHIQRAEAEDEAWKKVSNEYDAYAKKLQASLERRKKALEELKAERIPPPKSKNKGKSKAKAKGKARASSGGLGDMDVEGDGDMDEDMEDDADSDAGDRRGEDTPTPSTYLALYPSPQSLPPKFQPSAHLAHTILTRSLRPRHRPPNDTTQDDNDDLEQTLLSKLPTLQFKLDLLHTHLNAARATTAVCERLLDERFRVLNRHLDARMRSSSLPPSAPSAETLDGEGGRRGRAQRVLTTYISRSPSAHARMRYPSTSMSGSVPNAAGGASRSQSVPPPPPPPLPSNLHLPSPRTLLRTLTRIDAARPPAQIGDAARRAAREVQRVEESGMGAIAGERRVTLLPGMTSGLGVPATPRKGTSGPPGTPGRRTPGRERTPGR